MTNAPAKVLKGGLVSKSISAKPGVKGTIELGLFAPYNEIVELLGSWNDWQPIKMNKAEDGWWRAAVVVPDGDHLYKFSVKSLSYFALGKMLEVFDPYALSVTDEASECARLRVRNGERVELAYKWKHDDVPLPQNRDLVIYEMHIGDFTGGKGDRGAGKDREKGHFRHAIDKLDYLRDLGINCLELLPVKEFPGKGWGYTLRSLFAVENSYGTPEELCELIDESHARGMRVIIDGVYNHADSESPLTKIAYEYWFYKDNPDPKELHWGPKFDYLHFDENYKLFPARKYVIESIQYWVDKFHIDGIRFDATLAIRDFNVMRELSDAAFAKVIGIKPFFTIAEHVPEDPTITGRPEGGPMNAAWHDRFAHLIQAIMCGQDRDGFHWGDLKVLAENLSPAANGYKEGDRFINYLSSHDHDRAMQILGDGGKIFDEAAFRRMKLGMTLLFTTPGIPMLWMGNEFGFAAAKTLDPRPLDWTLLNNSSNKDLLEYTKAVIRIRNENPALRSDSFEIALEDQKRLVFGFKRWDGGGNVVLVVANLKDENADGFEVKDAGLEDGIWRDALHGNEIKVEGGVLRDRLSASEVKIFVKQG